MVKISFRPVIALLVLVIAGAACGPSLKLKEKIRVAGVFSGPVGIPGADPRSEAIHQALLQEQRDQEILYDFRATVSSADFERVVRDYARSS